MMKAVNKGLKNKFVYLLIIMLGFIFLLPSYAKTAIQPMPLYKVAVPEDTLRQYPVLPYKFIEFVKAVPKGLPAPLSEFQILLNNKLRIIEKDDRIITYGVGPLKTLDGVVIQKIEISAYLKAPKKIEGFGVVLDPKQCVSTRLLAKKFDFLIPKMLLSHPAPNAPIAFYTPDQWGKFAMGSTIDYPDCATGIGIMSFSDKQERKHWVNYVREQAPYLRERLRQRELKGQ